MNDMTQLKTRYPLVREGERLADYVQRCAYSAEVTPGVTLRRWLGECAKGGTCIPVPREAASPIPTVWDEGESMDHTRIMRTPLASSTELPSSTEYWRSVTLNGIRVLNDISRFVPMMMRGTTSPSLIQNAHAQLQQALRGNQEMLRAAPIYGFEPDVPLLNEETDARAQHPRPRRQYFEKSDYNIKSVADHLFVVMMGAVHVHQGKAPAESYPTPNQPWTWQVPPIEQAKGWNTWLKKLFSAKPAPHHTINVPIVSKDIKGPHTQALRERSAIEEQGNVSR